MTNNQSLIEIETRTLAVNDRAGDLVNEYLNSLDVLPVTKCNYEKALKKFFLYVQEEGLKSIIRKDIIAYKNSLKNKMTPGSIQVYMSAIRSFFSFLQAEGIAPNMTSGIKSKVSTGNKRDFLRPEQVKTILKECSLDTTPEGLRNKALIMLLVTTGLRTIEIERANIKDIQQSGSQKLLYIQGKGREGKDEFVVINDDTLLCLKDYLSTRPEIEENEPLFISLSDRNRGGRLTTRSIRRIIKTIFKSVGLDSDKLTAHSLRHTAVTLVLKAGATIQQAQAMARHKNINTTMIYAHNIDRLENAPENLIMNLLK
jgi:site-specific recombinase XerD